MTNPTITLERIITVVCEETGVSQAEMSTPNRRSKTKVKQAKEYVCYLAKKHLKKGIRNKNLTDALGYTDNPQNGKITGKASQIRRNVSAANEKLSKAGDIYENTLFQIERRLVHNPIIRYNVNDTWADKIKTILVRNGQPMTSEEISDEIVIKEPHRQNNYDFVLVMVKKELSSKKDTFKSQNVDNSRKLKRYFIQTQNS